jgi:hypothetical protein
MQILLHADPDAAAVALRRLDLTEAPLLAAVMQGYLARIDCTTNHPPLYPSFVAWGETVRALREHLAPTGWERNDAKNYSRTMHPNGRIAIAVATGDEATGAVNLTPCTKSAKGPSTVEALEVNRIQAWLPGMELPQAAEEEDEDSPPVTTWVLLMHHADNEIRAELSLPYDTGADGRIAVWQERILLRALPLDPEPIAVVPPTQPDIEVVVRRKA